jgi:hypothetical protein
MNATPKAKFEMQEGILELNNIEQKAKSAIPEYQKSQ